MTDQRDLFCPASPGFKTRGTSEEAAVAVGARVALLRGRSLHMLKMYPAGLTTDEAAQLLDESILSIRPRFSELKRLGKIIDSGVRRFNASGRRAVVWRVKP